MKTGQIRNEEGVLIAEVADANRFIYEMGDYIAIVGEVKLKRVRFIKYKIVKDMEYTPEPKISFYLWAGYSLYVKID